MCSNIRSCKNLREILITSAGFSTQCVYSLLYEKRSRRCRAQAFWVARPINSPHWRTQFLFCDCQTADGLAGATLFGLVLPRIKECLFCAKFNGKLFIDFEKNGEEMIRNSVQRCSYREPASSSGTPSGSVFAFCVWCEMSLFCNCFFDFFLHFMLIRHAINDSRIEWFQNQTVVWPHIDNFEEDEVTTWSDDD